MKRSLGLLELALLLAVVTLAYFFFGRYVNIAVFVLIAIVVAFKAIRG